MNGAIDLLHSERGIFSLALILAVTVLAALSIVTGDQWIDFAKWIAITLVASKTVTTAVETIVAKQPQIPRADVKE